MSAPDFKSEREQMVLRHLIDRGISDQKVIAAFRKVPREKFVTPGYLDNAYGDFPLPIGMDQTISQPYIVALMVEAVSLKPKDRVLEIGTGSGYETAILAEIASFVYSVERFPELAQNAQKILTELGYRNFKVNLADGTRGWLQYAPYDAIIISAAAAKAPASLLKQLALNGRMIIPVGDLWEQELVLYQNTASGLETKSYGGCRFVPLVGKDGWTEN